MNIFWENIIKRLIADAAQKQTTKNLNQKNFSVAFIRRKNFKKTLEKYINNQPRNDQRDVEDMEEFSCY